MSNDWWTPKQYIAAVVEVMGGIDLDPATCLAANKTVGAKKFYTEDSDGLSQEWRGRVFLNPPYGKLGSAFAAKLYESLGSGVDEAIMLVNSRATDADWFQPCFNGVICFTDHRIDFDSPYEKPTSSTHGSCFVYFGPNEIKFADVFARFGNVVKRFP
jgi:ParB family chromosome partitioning protein